MRFLYQRPLLRGQNSGLRPELVGLKTPVPKPEPLKNIVVLSSCHDAFAILPTHRATRPDLASLCGQNMRGMLSESTMRCWTAQRILQLPFLRGRVIDVTVYRNCACRVFWN